MFGFVVCVLMVAIPIGAIFGDMAGLIAGAVATVALGGVAFWTDWFV